MDIALVSPQFPPARGGISEHVYNLANALSKSNDVTVYTMLSSPVKDLPYEVVSLTKGNENLLTSLLSLRNYNNFFSEVRNVMKKSKFDVIHDHAYGCLLINRENILTTVHSTWHGERGGCKEQKMGITELSLYLASPFMMGIEKWRLNRYEKVVAVSNALKDEIVSHYKILDEKVSVAPNGVSDEFFDKYDGQVIRHKLGIKDDEIMLLYLGRLSVRKGIGLLLDSFRELCARSDKIKLVFGGIGEYEKDLKEFTKRNKLENKVIVAGNIPSSELHAHYAACDVFVLPSLYETFGIVLLEAMAQGKPVVATNIGGIPDVVGKDGILIEPDVNQLTDAIWKLVQDEGLRNRLGASAKKSAKRFLWSSVVKDIEGIYEDLL